MSPRVSEAHKALKRKEILAAAGRVFARLGFAQATMQDVIDEAGVSRGGVYLYFANKDELLAGLMAQHDEDVDVLFNRMLDEHGTVWGAVEAFLAGKIGVVGEFPRRPEAVFYEYYTLRWRDPEMVAFHRARHAETLPALARFFEAGVARGEFAPRVPVTAVAELFGCASDGLNLHALLLGGEPLQPETALALRHTLHHLLGVKAPLA